MPHPRLLGAGAILLALAAAAFLWPRETAAPPDSPASPQAQSEALPLRHALEDAGWRLVEAVEDGPDRRADPAPAPVALIGGAEVEPPPWFVLVRAIHRASPEQLRRYPPSMGYSEEARGECSGTLYRGGWVVTAAHCLLARDGSPLLRVELCIRPEGRERCGAAYVVHRAAVDLAYEPDGAAGYREDRALIRLPDDPGGGEALPQTARAEIAVGETLHIYAMGSDAAGRLAEVVTRCAQPVVDVRRSIIETRGDPEQCLIRGADSGSWVGLILPDGSPVQKSVVSSYDRDDPTRNFSAPLRPDLIRAAQTVWSTP